MRVIVSNQDPRPRPATMTNAAEPATHFATGDLDTWEGDVLYVQNLPKCQRDVVGFRMTDCSFATGPDLTYVDYWLVNRDELVAWMNQATPPEPEPASATKGYALSGVTAGQTANGYKARI